MKCDRCRYPGRSSVSSMMVGSAATSACGVLGSMWSQKPGPASISSPSAVKRSRPEMTCTTAARAGLVLGQFLTGVEAEHGQVHALVAVNHLGDNSARLDVHRGGDVSDHSMRHGLVTLPQSSAIYPLSQPCTPVRPTRS